MTAPAWCSRPACLGAARQASRGAERGFALLAVLVALSMLLALAVPFAMSMGRGDAVSQALADGQRAKWLALSARDLVLHQAARTHASVDASPLADGADEFPRQLVLPEAFAGLQGEPLQANLLAGEAIDAQRRINLNTATPLVLGNLLGLVARTSQEHEADASRIEVDSTGRFPDSGYLLVDRELIRYGQRDGTSFSDLERGLLVEEGYQPAVDHALPRGALVFDFRVVLAVMHSFYHRPDGARDRWEPYPSVEAINRIAAAGFGGFAAAEVDRLRATCTVASVRGSAATFGKPERIFEPLQVGPLPWDGRELRVRSAADIGGGRVVRIRSADGKHTEYALCWQTTADRAAGATSLPGPPWVVHLLRPPTRGLQRVDDIVEVMLPHPVNANTASVEVLEALITNINAQRRVAAHAESASDPFRAGEARELAADLLALRGDPDFGERLVDGPLAGAEVRPFDGFEDLATRFFKPHLKDADNRARWRWIALYRSFLGSDVGHLDMPTAPLSFTSEPVVAYRAAAARLRGSQVAAREERTGTAVAMPNGPLDLILAHQEAFERAFRLDQRAPFYTTYPINLGSWVLSAAASNPPSRHFAHVLPMVWPELGFGEPRFASRDGNGDAFALATAHVELGYPSSGVAYAEESMWQSRHPDGRDVGQEGLYAMFNTGPRAAGGPAPAGPQTHEARFPFTTPGGGGVVGRHALGFWFQPRDTADAMLFDLAADDADRNRISVKIEDQHLVLEVLDQAGLDPDTAQAQAAGTAPERSAGLWKVPLADIDLRPGVWYHVNASAEGNRPGQLSLLIDGVPRGEPELRTYLAQPIDEYITPPTPPTPFIADPGRYINIAVEDTAGFPPRGVLRIGLELFEYTALTPTTFRCEYDPQWSLGGRAGGTNYRPGVYGTNGWITARMDLREHHPDAEVRRAANENIEHVGTTAGGGGTGASIQPTAPPHPVGAAVELYGYTVPVHATVAALEVGANQLASALEPFAVARVLNKKSSVVFPGTSFPLGRGLLDTEADDLELGNPHWQATNPADARVAGAFPASGGYALLLQVHVPGWQPPVGTQGAAAVDVGGIEVISYRSRDGATLRGITRGVVLPGIPQVRVPGYSAGSYLYDGTPRQFVTEWNRGITYGNLEAGELDQALCYAVPVSLDVATAVPSPSTSAAWGQSEWLQLRPDGDEASTEWLRYDYTEGGRIVRSYVGSWRATHEALTQQLREVTGAGTTMTGSTLPGYDPVRDDGIGGIGHTEQVEVDFPQVRAARYALHFRGDPVTGTASHSQTAGTQVLPCHRFECDWGNYGALAGRAGRNDRVALVGGSQASATEAAPVEWHTVNWSCARLGADPFAGGAGSPPAGPSARGFQPEQIGTSAFQLVAFKAPVGILMTGNATPVGGGPVDSRFLDRMVKFPSGELPAAAPEEGTFGGTRQRDVADLRGLIDELAVVERRAPALLLDEPLPDDGATQLVVRDDLEVTALGERVTGGNQSARFPAEGGLLMVDGEVLAFESHSGGRMQIARNARGLLGTEPRAHDEGALVYLLDQVPAAILASAVNESAAQLSLAALGDLPPHGGTLLLGRSELLHYTWSVGPVLEMPEWTDPENPRTRGRGLFRGRYGTAPVSAQAGEPVIAFPFRYWDRDHERADDPELAYFQVTWDLAPVYFRGLSWEAEGLDPLVDLRCLVRVDGRADFAADPEKEPALFEFRDGSPDGQPNRIGYQGSRIELRFATVYRPGAFDAQTFLSHVWKQAPRVRWVLLDYEGESRVLDEAVTAR